MFQYSIIQNQWLILALGGGLVLVLGIALSYIAIWQPRRPSGRKSPQASKSTLQFIPWILVVTYVAILVYYLIGSTMHFGG